MWIQIYFVFSSLETLALLIYSLWERSLPQESVFLYYSGERLLLAGGILAILLGFAYLGWHSFFPESPVNRRMHKNLQKPAVIWSAIAAGFVLSLAIFLLLTQPPEAFGGRLTLFTRLEPLLLWLLALSLQTIFFLVVWYSVHFCARPEIEIGQISIKEMDFVLLLFLAAIVFKLIFVLPGTYGLYRDLGESKYFNMIDYLFKGKFYTAADDVTTHYPLFYPLLLLISYYVKNYTFHVIMLMNTIFSSSIVFPLYLLARRMLDRKYSQILIVIACLIPFQFLLPNRLLSENLYFPLLLWGIYLAFSYPQNAKQRLFWDIMTGVAFGLLYLTRFISLALIPFLMLIWWLKPFEGVKGIFHLNLRKIGHALLILLITALIFSPWVMIGLNNGLSLSESLGFGITANTNEAQLTILNLLMWLVFYIAYYLLLAAPVLNLIIIALQTNRLRDIRNEGSRWLLSALILGLGFTIAVVRHSWRAFYNFEMPQKIMGRYVIYIVPLALLCGFLGMSSFKREKFQNYYHFLFHTTINQLVLVALSYMLIIAGKLIPVGQNFIEPLISIDGFYIRELGGYFFVFILILYIGNCYFLWHGGKRAVEFAGCVLIAFYLFAEPDCVSILKSQNTYQKLGYTISEIMLDTNQGREEKLDYTIYLSDGLYVDDRKDFAWSLYVRNLDCGWQIVKYPAQEKPDLMESSGFVVYPVNEMRLKTEAEFYTYEINGEKFIVEYNLD